MKRACTLLLAAALCLSLAACHRYLPETGDTPTPTPEPAPTEDPEPVATDEPLELDALNVEFVAPGRDVDALVELKGVFPTALKNALKQNLVKVGTVNVTFGTSDSSSAEALRSGAVDVAFLAAETALEESLAMEALEARDMPDLTQCAVVQSDALPERFTRALLDSLSALEPQLKYYTGAEQGGVFVACTDEMRADLLRLRDTGETVIHRESTAPGGLSLTLGGVGCAYDYGCGIRAIEVRGGDGELVQTIEMSEAGEDLPMDATQCWSAGNAFRMVDVNFDGYDDIEVFGWTPSNTIPYLYWLWDNDAQRYIYSFAMQVSQIDPETKTVIVEYKITPQNGVNWQVEVYEWRDGELLLVSQRVDER